jgi:hypothetical protein
LEIYKSTRGAARRDINEAELPENIFFVPGVSGII